MERRPGGEQDRHQVCDLLHEALGNAADDGGNEAEQKNDVQNSHFIVDCVKIVKFADLNQTQN